MTLQKKLVNVGSYKLTGKRLGKGNFAKVEEAVHAILNIKVAIKILDVTQVKEDYIIKNLHREARILFQLRHPCIVALFQAMQHGDMYFLITEFMGGGDLCNFIKGQKFGKLDERNSRVYARQLISAVAHMHNLGIVHRDLKMENVMMNTIRTQVKIVDFGLSNRYDPDNPLRTHCGSPEYAAPELFIPGKCYGTEVDIWSLGVILYGMVVGQLPFLTNRDDNLTPQERRKDLLTQINRGYSMAQRKELTLMSAEFRYLMGRMLIADSKKRMSVNELVFNGWVTDRAKKAIVVNPIRELASDWKFSIMKQVGQLLRMDLSSVQYAISNDPYGDIAGMYNILVYKIQMQKLEGDGVTKSISNQSSHLKISRPLSSANEGIDLFKMKKHIESAKPPSILKSVKTTDSSVPRSVPQPTAVSTERHLQALPSATQTTKMFCTSGLQTPRHLARCMSPKIYQDPPEHITFNPVVLEIPPFQEIKTKARISSAVPAPPLQKSPAIKQSESSVVKVGSPRLSVLRSHVSKNNHNETVVVGTRCIPRIIRSPKTSSPVPVNTVERSSSNVSKQSSPISSHSSNLNYADKAQANRRPTTATPSSSFTRSPKKIRIIPVMESSSDPNKCVLVNRHSTTSRNSSLVQQTPRSRRVISKPFSTPIDTSTHTYASGDRTVKKTSFDRPCFEKAFSPEKATTAETQKLSVPKGPVIAKTIAGYLEKNIKANTINDTPSQTNRLAKLTALPLHISQYRRE